MCDDEWDDTDAGVVCRQLGFGSSGTAVGSAGFGQGSGQIWIDNVDCTGSESTLVSCGHLGVGITRDCSHSEDAGVKCDGIQGMLKGITTIYVTKHEKTRLMYTKYTSPYYATYLLYCSRY